MKQHYFVVRWDESDGWQIDHDVADAVLDGTLYDTDEERWHGCIESGDEKRDAEIMDRLTALLKGGQATA
jgi:hypothetical protein